MGGRWPRFEAGERLSRIGRGKAHALIGGELVRSRIIVSRGGNGQLQKQAQAHSRRTASTEGQEAGQQPEKCREGRRKGGRELILQKKKREKEGGRDDRGKRIMRRWHQKDR